MSDADRDTLESEVRYYSRAFPATFRRARGAELWAADGTRYIDFFCGAGALNYGHNLPSISARVIEYLEQDGIVHALDADTVAKREFLDRFGRLLEARGLPHRVQFPGPTGANAVEAALKLARKATGRTGIVAFSGSFHGMSLGALAVTANRPTTTVGVPVAHTTFVPYPDGPHGPFDSMGYLRRMLEDPLSGLERPAAVIVETVQMDGGVNIPPAGWLSELRALTEEHGVLLICDEVQIGCGRSGGFFCFEREGIVPDIVTLSKSLGGVGLPLSACLLRPQLDVWEPGEHTGTFRANQLALVAATAALELWEDPAFLDALAARIAQLDERLTALAAGHPGVQVRRIGMAAGLECASDDGRWARRTQRAAFEGGLVLETCGRSDSVLKVCPPLTIEPETLDEGCEILGAAVAQPSAAYT